MKKEKKQYEKPEAKKHKAAAVVSGSCSCTTYTARQCGFTYYH